MITTEKFILSSANLYTLIYAIEYCGVIVRTSTSITYRFRIPKYKDLPRPISNHTYTDLRDYADHPVLLDISAGYSDINDSICRLILELFQSVRARDNYVKVALYLIHQIIYAKNVYNHGFVIDQRSLGKKCGVTRETASKVVSQLKAHDIIQTKWIGNSYNSIASCYTLDGMYFLR